MNPLKWKYYLEVLAIAVGIVHIVAILPIQIFVDREIRPLTVYAGGILWYTIYFHNMTYHELVDKWFKRK